MKTTDIFIIADLETKRMMRKKIWSVLILTLFATALPAAQGLAVQEDTAQLTFTKTAIAKKPLHTYTVQKGDILSAIIRNIPGITEKEIPFYYQMIKELNPDIENFNKIQEGQEIVLPGKPQKAPAPSAGAGNQAQATTGAQTYQVKKGDTLIHIVHRELLIPSKTQQAMLQIKAMNPSLRNANKIYAGQIIRLPKGKFALTTAVGKEGEKQATPIKIVGEPVDVLAVTEERTVDEKQLEGKDAVILPPTQRLAVIKHILSQMNGSMLTSGNYYVPVSETEQLTIDCSLIPVVELDGQTIFLDQGDRSSSELKKMIGKRWSNHHIIHVDSRDDMVVVLKKIIKNTNNYEISKAQKSLSVGSHPALDIDVDWMIAPKCAKPGVSTISGLRFVHEPNSLLPRAVINYARKHSVFITEISPEKGLAGKPEEIYSLPPITTLPATSSKDLALALLSYLNVPAQKDVDIRVFNIEKDGFNLSIKADIVVERDGKKHLIFSRSLSPQFVNILVKSGNELIYVADSDPPAKTMETILRALRFVTVSGYFSFSGLDKNQPPYSFGFKGIKIKTDKDTYAVDFSFSEDLRGLMQEAWSANMIRY